jgi:hypothetical protein
MTHFLPLLHLLNAWAALWHTLAFAAGAVFVYFSYRAVFGLEPYMPKWGVIIRHADIHLWLSGFLLIGIGFTLQGMDKYLSNPKLWAKTAVIFVWFFSTQFLRHYALPKFRKGERGAMLVAASISLCCWLYGAFLGSARDLSYGNASFGFLGGGFALTLIVCLALTAYFEKSLRKS